MQPFAKPQVVGVRRHRHARLPTFAKVGKLCNQFSDDCHEHLVEPMSSTFDFVTYIFMYFVFSPIGPALGLGELL